MFLGLLLFSITISARTIRGTYNGTIIKDGYLVVKCKFSLHKCVEISRADDNDPYFVRVLHPDESLVFDQYSSNIVEVPVGEDTNVEIYPAP